MVGLLYLTSPYCETLEDLQHDIKMIFEKFTNKNKQTVYTPHKNCRNYHFYESLGFEKYGEAILSDKLTLFKYAKYN